MLDKEEGWMDTWIGPRMEYPKYLGETSDFAFSIQGEPNIISCKPLLEEDLYWPFYQYASDSYGYKHSELATVELWRCPIHVAHPSHMSLFLTFDLFDDNQENESKFEESISVEINFLRIRDLRRYLPEVLEEVEDALLEVARGAEAGDPVDNRPDTVKKIINLVKEAARREGQLAEKEIMTSDPSQIAYNTNLRQLTAKKQFTEDCQLCVEDFVESSDGDKVLNLVILPCLHVFHEDCWKDYSRRQKKCPIDRKDENLETTKAVKISLDKKKDYDEQLEDLVNFLMKAIR